MSWRTSVLAGRYGPPNADGRQTSGQIGRNGRAARCTEPVPGAAAEAAVVLASERPLLWRAISVCVPLQTSDIGRMTVERALFSIDYEDASGPVVCRMS